MTRTFGVALRAAAAALAILSAPVLGCEREGPAEEVGEEVDEAVEDAKDAAD